MFARLLSLIALAGLSIGIAHAELRFEWAYPQPHRQTWIDLTAANGRFIGLTDGFGGRSIFTSTDGKNWESISTPTNVPLSRLAATANGFLAIGHYSTILTSPDGLDWSIAHTDPQTGVPLFDIATGNNTTVAIGYNARAYVSRDNVRWSQINGLDSGYSLVGVQFGNNRFVTVGQAGKIWTSTDGFNWTLGAWPTNLADVDWSRYSAGLAFNNGVFVLSTDSGSAHSTDGINWTVCSEKSFMRIQPAQFGFFGLSSDGLYQSPSGASWQPILTFASPAGVRLTCAAQLNSLTIAAGDNGILYTSTDSGFQKMIKEVDYSHPFIAFGNNLYIRYGSLPGVHISNDGAAWQKIEAPALRALTHGNGLWVGIDSSGNAAFSSAAKSWTSISLPVSAGNRIAFANGRFITDAANGILTSTDGQTWQHIAIPTAQRVFLIGHQNGRWAAALDGQRPATSTDGLNWTIHPTQPALRGSVFAAGNGRFLGLGGAGMGLGYAVWSTNGIDWQEARLSSGTTHVETSLNFGGGEFLLTDNYGGIHRSPDGLNWTGRRQAPQSFTSAAYGDNQWLVAGGDSILRSAAQSVAMSTVKLQLLLQQSTAWSLLINGPANQTFEIQSTTDLNADWTSLGSVNIPLTGQTQIPINLSAPNRFYRALPIQR